MSDETEAVVKVDANEGDTFFECPQCNKGLVVDRSAAGMVVECTKCGQIMKVPGQHGPAEGMEPEDLADEFAEEQGADTEPRQRVCGEDEVVISKASVNLLFQEMAAIQNALDQIVNVLENNLRE